jgi:hypothetical protein
MSALTAGIQDENWLITPAALAVQEPTPTSISDQKWIIGLSGVAILFEDSLQGVAGNNAHDWRRATVVMYPDIFSPMQFAIHKYGIPQPVSQRFLAPVFSLEPGGWAPFAAPGSFLHAPPDYVPEDEDPLPENAVSFGVAVDRWRPYHFLKSTDVNDQPIPSVFHGIAVDLAVYGSATLYRVNYQATLVGKIAFGNPSY